MSVCVAIHGCLCVCVLVFLCVFWLKVHAFKLLHDHRTDAPEHIHSLFVGYPDCRLPGSMKHSSMYPHQIRNFHDCVCVYSCVCLHVCVCCYTWVFVCVLVFLCVFWLQSLKVTVVEDKDADAEMADATKHSDDEDIDTGAEIAGYAEQSVHSDVEDKDADTEMAGTTEHCGGEDIDANAEMISSTEHSDGEDVDADVDMAGATEHVEAEQETINPDDEKDSIPMAEEMTGSTERPDGKNVDADVDMAGAAEHA